MSEFIIQIENLLRAIGDPEYRYLLLEPIISYGLLAGVGMLVAGFCAKAPRLQISALVVIGVAAMAHFPYKEARLAAEPRMEQVYKISSPARVKGFSENTEAWIAAAWQFRLLVLCAFATLMIGIHRNRIGFWLSIATILLGLLAMKSSMWLNYQDALAYHPNLRQHDAPIDRKGRTDRKTTVPSPPPAEGTQRTRLPAAPVARPAAPAGPYRAEPVPAPPSGSEHIEAPMVPPLQKARKVQPLSRP